jgi:hypothetical protein
VHCEARDIVIVAFEIALAGITTIPETYRDGKCRQAATHLQWDGLSWRRARVVGTSRSRAPAASHTFGLKRKPVMSELKASELKVFLPAKNFAQSRQFYCDLGFTLQWTSGDGSLAYFQVGPAKFLLQNYFLREAQSN